MQNERGWIRPRDAWQFVDALAELPAADWLSAAARARSAAQEPAAAHAKMLVRQGGAALMAWHLHDAIDTAGWYCWCAQSHGSDGRTRAQIGVAIVAARMAALALLVRPRLGEQRFRILYTTFAELLPSGRRPERDPSREVFMESLCAEQYRRASVRGT